MKKSAFYASLFLVVVLLGATLYAQNRPAAATGRAEWVQFNPVTPLTAASFAHPPAIDRPWVRMNMPATADPAEIAAEVGELWEHGTAGGGTGRAISRTRHPSRGCGHQNRLLL